MAARMLMMAMTTRSSINVKARLELKAPDSEACSSGPDGGSMSRGDWTAKLLSHMRQRTGRRSAWFEGAMQGLGEALCEPASHTRRLENLANILSHMRQNSAWHRRWYQCLAKSGETAFRDLAHVGQPS